MKKKLVVGLALCLALSNVTPILASDYETHWASKEITKWMDKGIIEGYEDGTFRPDEPITHAEFAKILVELFGYSDNALSKTYQDVNVRKWYADYVSRISGAQIMYESDVMNFYPEAMITREEALYALANAYHLESNIDLPFYDKEQISPWAVDAFKAFYGHGYITGDDNQMIKPKDLLTRAELAMLLDQLMTEVIDQTSEVYEKDVEGNLLVNKRNVVLKNMKVNGDLYLTEGIGNGGKVTLENVIVTGQMFVADGVEVGQLNFEEGGYNKSYWREPTGQVQKTKVKGTVYRPDTEPKETYAIVTVKNLTTGLSETPIQAYNGEFSVDLVMYQDYEIMTEATIDGITYRDSEIIRGLKEPKELNFNLKSPESPSLEEDELYKERWKF